MTIKTVITQTCDGCNTTRELLLNDSAELAGWRAVRPYTHLCPECIDKALGKS